MRGASISTNLLSFLLLLSLVPAQLAIYRLHRRGRGGFTPGPRYPLSLPTRAFRWAKGPLYGLVVLHLVTDVLMADAPPARSALFAAAVIAAAALGLLHWSLEALGPNFAPCDRGILPQAWVSSGPYRWIPHPIYAANLLLLVAVAVASFGPLIVLAGAALGFFYAFAIHDEERGLRQLRAAQEGSQ